MLYFIIFFVVDFSLGRTPPDPRRAEERWLDQCRLYAGTWQRSWTGIWLSAKSPWTAAVRRSGWCLSEWCRWSFLQKRRTPDTTAPKTTARGGDIWECSLWKTRYHLKSLRHRRGFHRDGPTCRLHCAMQRWHTLLKMSTLPLNHSPADEVFKSDRLRSCGVSGHSVCCWRSWWLSRGWVCSVFFVSFCLKLKSSCNPKGKRPHWKCLKLKSFWWLMTTDDIRGTWWVVPFHRGRLQVQHNPL